MNDYIYSPSVAGLGGIMAPMDMTTPDTMMANLDYIGPLIATPDNRTVSMTGQDYSTGYGTSRAQYQAQMSGAPKLGGGIADIAAAFNMLDLFLGRK